MKKFTKKELSALEEKVYSVGINLSIITSLVKLLDIGMNDDLDVTDMDLSNLTAALKRYIFEIKEEYDKIEYLLDV